MKGPPWLGSWEGQSLQDICAGLTHVDSQHWQHASKACQDLIDRKVYSKFVGLTVLASLALTWSLLTACMNVGMLYVAKRF